MDSSPPYRELQIVQFFGRPIVLALLVLVAGVAYGTALALSISPLLLVAAPVGLALSVLAFVRPEWAAITLVGIEWGYLSEVAVKYHGVPSISKPLAVLLIVGLLVRRFADRRARFVYDPAIWWMFAYLFVISLGVWYAESPDRVLLLIENFAKAIVLFIVVINLIRTPKQFEHTMWLLLVIAATLGALAVYQEITQSYHSDFGGLAGMRVGQIISGIPDRPRAGGPTGEPNAFGQQLLVLVPIGLWAMLRSRSATARLTALLLTAMCLAGVGLSFSRSSYLALGVVLALFALYIRLQLRYVLLVLPLVGLLFWVAPSEVTARFATLQSLLPGNEGVQTESSFRRRSVEMLMAVNMFADHPLLGVGGGNYALHYPHYIRAYGSPVPDEQRDAHSYYLEIAAEHGLLGLIAWGGILVIAATRLREAHRHFLRAGSRRLAELATALLIGYTGYLVSAMFLHGVYSQFLWLLVSLAAALALIARRVAASEEPVTVHLAANADKAEARGAR